MSKIVQLGHRWYGVSMNVSLPPELEKFTHERVAAGL